MTAPQALPVSSQRVTVETTPPAPTASSTLVVRQDRLTVEFAIANAPELPEHGKGPAGRPFTPTTGTLSYRDGYLHQVRLTGPLPRPEGASGTVNALRTWSEDRRALLNQPLSQTPDWLERLIADLASGPAIRRYLAAPRA